MNKDEMKNRISMALKAPTLQQGFEIICKNLAELEKENAELKEYNKYLKRKRQGGIQKQYNKVAIIKQQDEQLTEAKELLAKWVELYKPKLKDFPKPPIQVDTEAFLKE